MPFKTVDKVNRINNVLCDDNFDPKNIVFGPCLDKSISNSSIKFKKIPLYYEYEPGKYSSLLFKTPSQCFSFGIQDQKNLNTGALEGYSLALNVFHPESNSEEEKQFMNLFNAIEGTVKEFLQSDEAEEILGTKYAAAQLDKIASAMFYRTITTTEGKKTIKRRDETRGPTFYPKLFTRKNQQTGELEMTTPFYEVFEDGRSEEITEIALETCKTKLNAQAVILVESIFIGATGLIRLQFRAIEVNITRLQASMTRFLNPDTSSQYAPSPSQNSRFSTLQDETGYDN